MLLAADVALNPVASGGGSNLKMADYFSHALPVVTTQPGARGFAIENGVTALVVGPADFPAALEGLGASPDRREALALAGRDLATSALGWDRLGEAFADLVPEAPVRRRLRLLVATYRFTEPALGGAEAYLAALLGALDARGDVTIDLEAVSVGDIFNLSRFIAHAPGRAASAADAIAPYLRRLTLHPPDATDPAAETAACWRLYHLWQAEALALGRAFAGQLDRPLPLGGWHPPEWADGAPWRWSAGIAELFVPPGFVRLHLDAWHETPGARLDCAIDGVTVASIRPAAQFALDLDLDPATGGIVRLAMTPPRPADDVLIERAWP